MIRRYIILLTLLLIVPLGIRSFIESDSGSETDGVKAVLVPFARFYLDAFHSPSTAVSLSIGMVVAGIALLIYYWFWRISPALRDLKATSDKLKRVGARPGSSDVVAEIDRVMASSSVVAKSWLLYRSTLRRHEHGGVSAQFQPSRYFNTRSLDRGGVRLGFFLGLPNDFVGIGLIFTFLGLVAGLYFASKSMMSSDLEAARTALYMLLNAATFKFLTSIAGIGVSLLLSITQRFILEAIQTNLEELQFQVETLLPLADGSDASIDAPSARRLAELRAIQPSAA